MKFFRVIKDSNELSKVIDIPKGMINKKLEVIISPYEDIEKDTKHKSLRAAFSAYHKVREYKICTFDKELEELLDE